MLLVYNTNLYPTYPTHLKGGTPNCTLQPIECAAPIPTFHVRTKQVQLTSKYHAPE